MIDVDPKHLSVVRQILQQHVPGCRVWAFGSRVNREDHHPYADLDLALDSQNQGLSWQQLEDLRDAFACSDLPMSVDVCQWHELPKGVQQQIATAGEKLALEATGSQQQGFTIVSAVFILAVMAVLGVFMVRISGVQQQTSTMALQASRAYFAARSGLEWGLSRAVNDNACSDATFQISGFDVAVTCSRSSFQEGSQDYHAYYLISEAVLPDVDLGSPDYVRRKVEVTATVASGS